jgi:hypothetical protein
MSSMLLKAIEKALSRRALLGKIVSIAGTLGLGILGLPRNVQAGNCPAGTYKTQCCCMCFPGSSSCSGHLCVWGWPCCDGSGPPCVCLEYFSSVTEPCTKEKCNSGHDDCFTCTGVFCSRAQCNHGQPCP